MFLPSLRVDSQTTSFISPFIFEYKVLENTFSPRRLNIDNLYLPGSGKVALILVVELKGFGYATKEIFLTMGSLFSTIDPVG